MNEHRCVAPERRTPRIQAISAFLGAWKPHPDGRSGPRFYTLGEVLYYVEQQVKEMREKGLCLECGYPLDNTDPHPDAQRRTS